MTWTQRYSVLYVDQPVGTGFSFTDDEAGYARNLTDVGRDMLEFLQQFFTLFDHYNQNEFYITGESYAGAYAVLNARNGTLIDSAGAPSCVL
ncbi:hypothetical protein HPB48_022290 [Haemaphysalis longicornis]|uniref:Carboxypeptidase n=1 Tax=Haemaphysalis longicornis TaxID=44386 RepID=A0A9J6G009_HAELO|nr:hypothetical protein HPB48_022290 [Haemaphysalis longicornis]